MDNRRRRRRSARDVALESDPDNLLPIDEGSDTGTLMSQEVEHVKPRDMNDIAKTHMMELFKAKSENDLPDRAFVIQHGKGAVRPGEAAEIINHGQYEGTKRNADGVLVPCWVVRYKRGELRWVPQSTPSVDFETPLPMALRIIKPTVWLEMVHPDMIEERFCVKGRKQG